MCCCSCALSGLLPRPLQEDWEQELVRVQAQIEQQVAELSRKRQAAAVRLGSGVEAGLRELSMASSRFDVRISRRSSAEVSCLVSVDFC